MEDGEENSAARKGGKGSVSKGASEGVVEIEIGSKRGDESELAIVVASSRGNSRSFSSSMEEGEEKRKPELEAAAKEGGVKAGTDNNREEVKT